MTCKAIDAAHKITFQSNFEDCYCKLVINHSSESPLTAETLRTWTKEELRFLKAKY